MKETYIQKYMAELEATRTECEHKMGGNVRPDGKTENLKAFLHGDSEWYSVIRHVLPNGGTMVLCLRCGKEWHPADPVTNAPATDGWSEAMVFPTTNRTSGGVTFRFPKAAKN